MTNPTTFEGAYYNIAGDSKLSGVELNYNSVVEDISLAYNLNYTYLKTEDNNGDELPRRAKNSANLSFDYYGIASTHLGANVSYIGDRKKSPYDTNPKKDYDSYTLVDLVAGYDLNDALNIYAKIDNVLDKEYENITGYGVSERAYYLGFRYRVK
jgi:vitamin B12 transporter